MLPYYRIPKKSDRQALQYPISCMSTEESLALSKKKPPLPIAPREARSVFLTEHTGAIQGPYRGHIRRSWPTTR